MESVDYKGEKKKPEDYSRQEIFSKTIRAGKRTYFFDVKSTRNDEYYLTITESKRKFLDNENFRYEKHKLFLYPEDFEKFASSLDEIIQYIYENQPELKSEISQEVDNNEPEEVTVDDEPEIAGKDFSNIDFEDI
ncbi:MAG: PUR family DNA/RNA-binding protein [Mariniphaga sp.]|nr:PUR family DNA/RNA-binding protein [Mariniphaga sp.]